MTITLNGTTGITTPGETVTGVATFATTIGVGNATPSGSGAGITFPATQSASSDANTLDDYEEGTFTVAVRGSTTAGTYTITSQSCSYTKIGRLVYLVIAIGGFSAASGGAGYMQITGLPFANTGAVPGVLRANLLDYSAGSLWVVPAFITSSGATTLYLEEMRDNGNSVDFSIGGVSTSTTSVIITISYQV